MDVALHAILDGPTRAAPPRWTTVGEVDAADRTDEELLDRVATRRDRDAFDELYRRYSRAVYSLVLRTVRDAALGEDVVQETFTAVWRKASSYRVERGSATTWLFTVARNAAVDAIRARKPVVGGEVPDTADAAPTPEEQTIADLEAFRVHAAVDTLPDREREVIELAYFDGLSQSQVAQRLELPLGTVKTRTRAGLARLAERLEQERVML
jgi:RNA polymerase sigma-70 factor (ECF subfamily)